MAPSLHGWWVQGACSPVHSTATTPEMLTLREGRAVMRLLGSKSLHGRVSLRLVR